MCLWLPVACGLRVRACVCIYIYTKPRQQKFRAMNGAHLASSIRGELGYAHWPQLGSQIHCPIGNQIWGPLGKEDVCPNFALTVGKFVFINSGNLGQRQIRQSPGLALTPIREMTGPNSSADWDYFVFNSFRYFEPVECFENRSDVVVFQGFSNSTGESILKGLEAVYLGQVYVEEERITVV